MGWLGILILVVWGLMTLWGWKRGLIGLAIPLLMVVVGLAVSSRLAEPVGNLFSAITDDEALQTGLAFVGIFACLFLLSVIGSSFLRRLVGIAPFGDRVDRLGGALVGFLVGFALLSGLLVGLQKYPIGSSGETIGASPVASFMADSFGAVVRAVGLIPGDWVEKARDLLPDPPDRKTG